MLYHPFKQYYGVSIYPVGAIVFLELFLRAISGDDDDDDEGGGIMTPVYQGA